MPKVILDVPEEVAEKLRAMEAKLKATAAAAREGAAELDVDSALAAVDEAVDATALEMKRRVLQGLDTDAPRLLIDGELHARVGRYTATYKTRQGPLEVERSLYRRVGERNGPTVDAIRLRAGCVGDGWLPEAARAMAHLLACGTSREAQATANALKVLPYSRASFERVGHDVAALYGAQRPRVEAALADGLEVPEGAHSLSLSLDRVSVPMEEPKPRPVGRPKKGAPRRPVARTWRMAYVGCLTLHDEKGEALHSLRYGRMPLSGAAQLAERLALDVQALLTRAPALAVVVLTDGAPELHALLDEALASHAPAALNPVRLVDFWHLMEKLGSAARLLAGDRAPALHECWKMALLNRSGAVWRIATELHVSGKRNVRVADSQPVHEALTYLENHGERMGYAEARAQALPIGSGNVEATCKSLVGLRMKRPGSRWKETTGQHVLDLRSLMLSERWDSAMNLTLAPLQRRIQAAA
jgi:hypothetical protein